MPPDAAPPARRPYVIREVPASGGRIDYEKVLNPRQAEAVLHDGGPLLVVAGAGTGKTRTLIYRVARLVETGVPPASILLLTFTRRASEEMLRRAAVLLDRRCESVAGGTFHSFANLLLRRHGAAAGLSPEFTILDRSDAEDLVGLLRHEVLGPGRTTRFPRKETIADLLSRAANREEDLADLVAREAPHFLYALDDILRIRDLYAAAKRDRNLADYDDLLVHAAAVLRDVPSVREEAARTYRHVLVDEYQDTNRIQAEILRQVAGAHGNAVAVGDDAQSIYSFRGARFRNIIDFPADFPGAKVVTLEENYRSVQPVLDVTNAIIAGAAEKFPKRLFAARGDAGERPAVLSAPNERLQSAFVADRILELHEERGIPLSDIAVLFRAAYLSFDLEVELAKRRIPYRKYGGFRFLEVAHVKDVIAHLRLVRNPRDTLSLSRALQLVPGIGRKTGSELALSAREGASLAPVLAALSGMRRAAGAERLAALIAGLASSADPGGEPALPLPEMVARVVAYYRPLLEAKYDDWPRRLKDLEHLESLAARYRSLTAFLSEITLEPPEASAAELAAPDGEDEHLTLSTIHSAKGLEWRAVFVIWTLDGKIPSARAAEDGEGMEEERRLLYVAATRAKDVLVFTYPVNVYERATGTVLSKPSRFIEEIPGTILPRYALIE